MFKRSTYRVNRVISFFLIALLLFGCSSTMRVNAVATSALIMQDVEMQIIDDHTIQFTEDGIIETVRATENQVVISNHNTGSELVLTINGNSIHSSATGETVTILDSEREELVNGLRASSHPKTASKSFSYAKIKSLLGGTATVAGVAGVLVALLLSVGIAVPTAIPKILTYFSGIAGLVASVMKGSSKHGFVVKLKENKRITHRQGKEYIVWVWGITSIRTY